MKNGLLSFTPFLALLLILMPTSAISQQTIKVATFNSPFSTVMREVMLEAYKRIDIDAQILHLPGKRALKLSSMGAVDAELYRMGFINETSPDLIKVPVPLYLFEIRAFSKNFDFKPDGWQSLQNYKVGVVSGVKITARNTEGMQKEAVNSVRHMFALLQNERIDIALTTNIAGSIAMKELKLNSIKALEPAVHSFPVYHFVHKNKRELVPKLTAALTQMKNQGVINQIITRELETIYNGIEIASSP